MTTRSVSGVIIVTCEYPPFPGGIGTYSGCLVQAVRDLGFSATVIAPSYPELPEPKSDLDTHRILRHHRITPRAAWRMLAILRKAAPDLIVLAADIRSVLAVYSLRAIHGRSYRATVYGSEISKVGGRSPLSEFVRRAYLTAEMVACCSTATLDLFRANVGVPENGVVTYLGVGASWFESVEGEFEHAALAALAADASIVCSVGRIEQRKGQLETVRALARAREAHDLHNPVYVIAGHAEDEAYAAQVLKEAKGLNVPVLATGPLSQADLKRLYQSAACHVLFAQPVAGRIEGFGLVLLEAAAQRCPSVASDLGGIPEVLGNTGVLVQPGDIAAAARAIASYAGDRDLRSRHGDAAHRRATSFTWHACAKATFPELIPTSTS